MSAKTKTRKVRKPGGGKTPIDLEYAVMLNKRGWSRGEIAKELGCHYYSLDRACKANGITLSKGTPSKPP